MFELPEYITLRRQIDNTIRGKIIQDGTLGNSPHKFVWYNRTPVEFNQLVLGKRIGKTVVYGRWMSIDLEPGYRLLLGECGGKLLFHKPGNPMPAKYHLSLVFSDDSFLTALTTMWGAMELYESGQELHRQYIRDMRRSPIESGFNFDYFTKLIDSLANETRRSVKSLLTQDQLIPGLGNAIAQDIMFNAHLHPKHLLVDLTRDQLQVLFASIQSTLHDVIKEGGRYDEVDLFGNPGGYIRIMDKNATGKPCRNCGTTVEKKNFIGGTCYYCSGCQV